MLIQVSTASDLWLYCFAHKVAANRQLRRRYFFANLPLGGYVETWMHDNGVGHVNTTSFNISEGGTNDVNKMPMFPTKSANNVVLAGE